MGEVAIPWLNEFLWYLQEFVQPKHDYTFRASVAPGQRVPAPGSSSTTSGTGPCRTSRSVHGERRGTRRSGGAGTPGGRSGGAGTPCGRSAGGGTPGGRSAGAGTPGGRSAGGGTPGGRTGRAGAHARKNCP